MLAALFLATLFLAGCGPPTPLPAQGPAFDPLSFFTGHVTSWGVLEDRGGAPVAIVMTDCEGVAAGAGAIRMVQVLHVGRAAPQTRIWRLRQVGPDRYIATANDMAGEADATVAGRTLHWRWVLRTAPGDGLVNVAMEQWMYRMDDGAVVIRTVVTKLGVRLTEVTEQFVKQPDATPR